jgi:hypothetical protein
VTAHVDATWRLCRALESSLTMLNVKDAVLVLSTKCLWSSCFEAIDGFRFPNLRAT